MTRFLLALVTTGCIEILVLLAILRFLFHDKSVPLAKNYFYRGILHSTDAALSLVRAPPFVDAAYYPVIGETLAVIVEAAILNRVIGLDAKTSAVCSLVMNAASFFLGYVLL